MAQRLMRRICPLCKSPIELSAEDRMGLPFAGPQEELTLFRGTGCAHCKNTGYQGRVGIFELLPMSQKVRREIITGLNLDNIIRLAKEEGLKSLREAAWEKVKAGTSTLQELWRVTQEEN